MGLGLYFLAAAAAVGLVAGSGAAETPPVRAFRAGAYAMDVSPTSFPVIVNGDFFAHNADETHDPLHVRWLVLDDGTTRLALGVLDTCLIPAEFADAVKARAQEVTGLAPERIMLSANTPE